MEVKAAPTTCHRAKFLGITPRTKEVTLILVISTKMGSCIFLLKKAGQDSIAHTPLRSPPATSKCHGFEIFRIFPKVENVFEIFQIQRNLKIWFRDFHFFRACGAQIDVFLKKIVDLPLKYPKIFACGAKICVQGFEIFRKFQNFETNVLRFFKNFQISSQGFKVLSLKFPNLRQWF